MMALIDEATPAMRPVVAMLVGTGVRNGELCARDEDAVNLATDTGRVGRTKTNTGSFRELDLPAGVVEILTEWKLRSGWMRRAYEEQQPDESPMFLPNTGEWSAGRPAEDVHSQGQQEVGEARDRADL
jgi:integrase